MSDARLPPTGRRYPGDPLGLLPRDVGWVRRYVLAELLERPAAARGLPRRGPRPLPAGLDPAHLPDHPKL